MININDVGDDEENRKPTITEKLDYINISLNEIKNEISRLDNDDIELLKLRIDNIEMKLQNQNKLINDIEANIKQCIYQIYCKL